jgi:hypothetical protein
MLAVWERVYWKYILKLFIVLMNLIMDLKFMFITNNQTGAPKQVTSMHNQEQFYCQQIHRRPFYNIQAFAFEIYILIYYYQIIHIITYYTMS